MRHFFGTTNVPRQRPRLLSRARISNASIIEWSETAHPLRTI